MTVEVRLIDANKFHEKIMKDYDYDLSRNENIAQFLLRIETAPTIEAEPVRHGRWIFVGEETTHDGWTYRKHKCSECGFSTVEAINFCPNCGADMRGKQISKGGITMTDNQKTYEAAICEAAHVSDIGDVSDGFHTFNQLYHQRAMLFAALVNQNRGISWKSRKHEDGEPCFGGGWFLVTVDTPKGAYGYHYENKYWDMFRCKELEKAKPWDGYTEEDVGRLMSLDRMPTIEPKVRHGRWIWFESEGTFIHLRKCSECGDIKAQAETNFCPNCGAKMREVRKDACD